MNFQEYNINTSSLLLRPFSISDANIMFSLSQELGMKKWIPDQVYKDENEARNVLEYLIAQYKNTITPSDKPFVLGIVLKETNLLIGHVGLSPAKGGIEIGYAIADNQKRKGYATEAVSSMSDWAIKNLNISKIFGYVASDNTISCRVLEKSNYLLIEERFMSYHNSSRNVKIYAYK